MTELYGIPMATCARKALHVVYEKSAPIQYREIERAQLSGAEYRRLNPAGLVPVLVLSDSRVLVESSIIMRYIDDAYPGPRLQPNDPYTRSRMNLWMKWVDERYFMANSALTIATFIRSMLGSPLDEPRLQTMLRSLNDPVNRALREEVIRQELAAPSVIAALATLSQMLRQIEEVLKSGAWLAGSEFSLAESAVFPIVWRLQELGLDDAWNARLPRVTDWWKRLCNRPSTLRMMDMVDEDARAQIRASADARRSDLLSALIQG